MARDGKEADRTGQIHVESRTQGKEGTDTYRVTYTEEGRDRYISSHVHGGRKGRIHIESGTRRKEGTDTYRVTYTAGGKGGGGEDKDMWKLIIFLRPIPNNAPH